MSTPVRTLSLERRRELAEKFRRLALEYEEAAVELQRENDVPAADVSLQIANDYRDAADALQYGVVS